MAPSFIAGKLWFDHLTVVLRKFGFVTNGKDPCVMNKTVSGEQLTVCLFVDDILATCASEEALTELIDQLKEDFEVVIKGSVSDDFSAPTWACTS